MTSKGVGMAVPDWPTSFGYNMFWLPLDKWWGIGGIHDEHLHRLVASTVGALVVVLAVWAQLKEPRRWVRNLAWTAVAMVLIQGLLGGLRVVLDQKEFLASTLGVWFGIAHATLGQLFFSTLSLIAFVLSPTWHQFQVAPQVASQVSVDRWLPWIVGLILVQLVVAATMRHQHAPLAIPDFPLAYGQIWPDTDPATISRINARRIDPMNERNLEAFHIHLQMVHRLIAVALVTLVTGASWVLIKHGGLLGRLGRLWIGLLLIQFSLGAATVWTNKSADVATAHVAVGAISLMMGILLTVASRMRYEMRISKVSPCSQAKDFLKPARPNVPAEGGAS